MTTLSAEQQKKETYKMQAWAYYMALRKKFKGFSKAQMIEWVNK
jgi:hypothetical protein